MSPQNQKYTHVPGGAQDSLPMYEMRPSCDLGPSSALPESAPLHAGSSASCDSPKETGFEKYVPYQLELDNVGLFPEFYYHFNKNFSHESAEKGAYCSRNILDFTASYTKDDGNLLCSAACVEDDFDMNFRRCLHPELLAEFSGWTFTRDRVENEFRQNLENRKDLVSASIRLEALDRQMRKDWRVQPVVDFLTAFGHSELSIWFHLIQVLGLSSIGHKENLKALKVAAGWQSDVGAFSRRAQAFADLYKAAAEIEPEFKFLFLRLIGLLTYIFFVLCAVLFLWFIFLLISNMNG